MSSVRSSGVSPRRPAAGTRREPDGRSLAGRLQLERGAPVQLQTANGRTTGYRTQIERLQLGDIVLRDVRAVIAPGFDSEQILLGMSALKRLEFTQRAGTLVLRQHATDRP